MTQQDKHLNQNEATQVVNELRERLMLLADALFLYSSVANVERPSTRRWWRRREARTFATREVLNAVKEDVVDALCELGIEPITGVGTSFNPIRQRVIFTVATKDIAAVNRVLEEVRVGYFDNRSQAVIRPQEVAVAVRKKEGSKR